jgi:L-iditol 2-dehydrogenase
MKAGFIVGEKRIELREIADPTTTVDGLVLEVAVCGVCGSDLRRWKEGPPIGTEPVIAGHELAGTVVEVGSQVRDFRVGDRLAVAPDVHCGKCEYCQRGLYNLCNDLRFLGITPGFSGGFARRLLLSREVLSNGIVHPLPDDMSFIDGALAEPLSSVLAAHEKTNTGPDHTVVVMGAGPIGCLHAVVAGLRGARVIISEPSPIRRKLAQPFIAEALIDPSGEDVVASVRRLTGGLGADIVICANPVAATQTQAVELVRKAGKVVFFGGLPKAAPLTTLDANRIHYGEITVVGSFSYHPRFHAQALKLLQRNMFPVGALVTHTFPLEEIEQAFTTAASGEALKVMVEI